MKTKSLEHFATILNVPQGRHEFKFSVDDHWRIDETLPTSTAMTGERNNLLVVNMDDFHVFDALDRDEEQSANTSKRASKNVSSEDISAKDIRELPFTQDIPDRKDFKKAHKPPKLPPHLLQVKFKPNLLHFAHKL